MKRGLRVSERFFVLSLLTWLGSIRIPLPPVTSLHVTQPPGSYARAVMSMQISEDTLNGIAAVCRRVICSTLRVKGERGALPAIPPTLMRPASGQQECPLCVLE